MPFGDDPNDLPLHSLQVALNASLIQLLEPNMATCPDFEITERSLECDTYPCPDYLTSREQHKVFVEHARTKEGPWHRFVSRLSFSTRRNSVKQLKKSVRAERRDTRKSQKKDELGVRKRRDTKAAVPAESKIDIVSVTDKVEEASVSTSLDSPEVAKDGLLRKPLAASTGPSQGSDLSQTRNPLETQLQAHSARMDEHFSKISGLLNDHLSFMVQDLDAVFASYRKATIDIHMADLFREGIEASVSMEDGQHERQRPRAGIPQSSPNKANKMIHSLV